MFQPVTQFSTDYKGKFGEELLYKLIQKLTDFNPTWDADSNTNCDDGVYDIHWKTATGKKRVEVKTSGRTVANGKPIGWQHENVYFADSSWDKLVFLDYDATDVLFITVVSYDDVVKDGELDLSALGKKGHVRKNTGGKAKVDFSPRTIKLGLQSGMTFAYHIDAPDDEALAAFLVDKLS